MNALLVAALLAAAVIQAIVLPPLARRRRRAQRARTPLSAELRSQLGRTRAWRRLPAELKPRLAAAVHDFLGEHAVIGCGGLSVTFAMQVTIAAEACLLVIGRGTPAFAELRTILLYPDEFLVPDDSEEHGIVTTGPQVLSGQAWDTTRIILSWRDVAAAGEGYNVVIHEFAHYLEAELGPAAAPAACGDGLAGAQWRDVMSRGREQLERMLAAGTSTVLDPYALESDAEFFAVASETFFELAPELARAHPELYAALSAFYRLDPAAW